MRSAHAPVHIIRMLLILGLVVGPLMATSERSAAAGSGSWTQQAPWGAPAIVAQLRQVQCPSVTVCYAVGSYLWGPSHPVLEKTTDGGATWNSREVDSSPYSFYRDIREPLSCPSVAICYLLTNTGGPGQPCTTIQVTLDGGQTWSERHPGITCSDDVGIESAWTIACPSTRVCYVIGWSATGGPHLLITRDGGATWSSLPLARQPSNQVYLVCPGIDDCYLSGVQIADSSGGSSQEATGIAVTHDGGRTWRTGPAGEYSSIACPTTTRCYAAVHGEDNLVTTDDGGRTWSARRLPVTGVDGWKVQFGPTIACPTARICYAIDGYAIDRGQLWRTLDGGTTWTPESGDTYGVTGVSAPACPAPTTCYAVADGSSVGKIVKTTDGRTWHEPTPFTRNTLDAVACPSSTTCYAVAAAGTVLTTSDDGTTWVRRPSLPRGSFVSITCPGLRVCLATGQIFPRLPREQGYSILLRTSDGGQTWHTEKSDKRVNDLASVTCPSLSVCFATGGILSRTPPGRGVVLRTADGGHTWTTAVLPQAAGPGNSIACPTTRQCIAVGGVLPPGCLDDPAFLSGPHAGEDCAEHGWLFRTTDGGRHWRRQITRTSTSDVGGADLLSAACPTARQCYAGGYVIWARSTQGGRAWSITTALQHFAGADILSSLSCTSISVCWGLARPVSSGSVPVRTTDGGQSWQTVAGNVPLVDSNAPWSGALSALTCPRPNTCFAVGQSGLIIAYSP